MVDPHHRLASIVSLIAGARVAPEKMNISIILRQSFQSRQQRREVVMSAAALIPEDLSEEDARKLLDKRRRQRIASNNYWQRNKDECQNRQRERRKKDEGFSERNKEYCKKYYQQNREREIERAKEWQKNNPERYNLIMRRSHQKNKEKRKEITDRWRAANPERKRASSALRRARSRSNADSAGAIAKYVRGLKHVCHWCKAKLPENSWHMDHVIPLAKGGTHTIGNIVKSCVACNLKKGDRTPDYLLTSNQLHLL